MRIGNVQLATPLLLAPLAGYTDLPFRLIVRRITGPSGGVGLACTELICDRAVLKEAQKTLGLAATNAADQPLCVQLYGRDPDTLVRAAQWAWAGGAAIIDLNMGCPVDKVTKTNGGSRLLCEPDLAVRLARRVVQAVPIPVTAKIRLGWDDSCIIGPELAPRLVDVGIAAVTVHGRTTAQLFRGSARLAGIAQVVAAVKKKFPAAPVIGNGDVKTPADAQRMLAVTGCDGVMIGRGALGQPWLFRDTAHFLATGQALPPLAQAERVRIVVEHFNLMLEHKGARAALNMIRGRMSWYSPHLQPWPHLRRDVHALQSAQEVGDYLARGLERIAANAPAVCGTPRLDIL